MADESLSAIAVADPAPAPRAERGPVDAVADQLENFLTEQRARLARLDPALAPLLRTATDAVLAGGKRMRPTFAHWGWRAAAGPEAPLSHVLPALAALELMHAFALVHDDIMDASLTRRGRPTAHVALAHAPPVRPGTLDPLGKRRRVEAAVSGPGHVVVVGAGLGGAGSCRRHTVLGHAHARPDRAVPPAQRPSTTVQCGVRRLRDDARCRRAHGHHLRKACLRPAHGTPHRSVTGTPPVGRTRHARPTGGPITKGATMSKAQQLWGLAVFALAVTVVAVAGSLAAIDAGAEYNALRQPSWAPPSWLFGPVWTVLYALIALSGWLVWRRVGLGREIAVYAAQLVFNAAWTPLFFGAGRFGLAFAEIVVLWALIGVTVVLFRRVSRPGALLLVPYWLWVTFAAALNFAVWRLNP